MPRLIPHNRPLITAADRAAVASVLESGWIAEGSVVAALEASVTRQYHAGSACAVSSGTAALYLALHAAGAGPGATVAVPSYACSALLNAVFMTRAAPAVMDVQPDTFCLNPYELSGHPAVAFVIAVHAFGAAADTRAMRSPGRVVIEDCCQAIGGQADDAPLGACGDAAVFSFYATKIVTGGQGGMVWSRTLTEKIRDFRQFDGRSSYAPRFNFQLTDIQAALANSQLGRLESIRARRAAIAADYLGALPPGLATQAGLGDRDRMVQRFVIVAPESSIRDRLRAHLATAGIESMVPVERFELLHRYLGLDPGRYPVAERLAETTLSLPLHLCLSDSDVAAVCEALQRFHP